MNRPLCILRPEPGWSSTAGSAAALGIAVIGAPLFVAESVVWSLPDTKFDGLLIGSARVFDSSGDKIASLHRLPVYAVGQATADAALAEGFEVARTGNGNLQQLLGELADTEMRLLRLMGEDHVTLDPPNSIALTEIVTYRMKARPVAPELAQKAQERSAVVALHSASAARHWASECDRLGVARQLLVILALSQRIAAAAGEGWRSVHIADCPDDAALLAKGKLLCKG